MIFYLYFTTYFCFFCNNFIDLAPKFFHHNTPLCNFIRFLSAPSFAATLNSEHFVPKDKTNSKFRDSITLQVLP